MCVAFFCNLWRDGDCTGGRAERGLRSGVRGWSNRPSGVAYRIREQLSEACRHLLGAPPAESISGVGEIAREPAATQHGVKGEIELRRLRRGRKGCHCEVTQGHRASVGVLKLAHGLKETRG